MRCFACTLLLSVQVGGKSKAANSQYSPDKTRISSDQGETDQGIRSLINCYKSRNRIVLLADDKYELFPYDLKQHTYVVLGFYRIVHYWGNVDVSQRRKKAHYSFAAEYEEVVNDKSRCVKYKFAFQWCNEQGRTLVDSPSWYVSRRLSPLKGQSSDPGLVNQEECRNAEAVDGNSVSSVLRGACVSLLGWL